MFYRIRGHAPPSSSTGKGREFVSSQAECHSPGLSQGLGLDRVVSSRRTGLSFGKRISFSTWQRIGKQIALISHASCWWLGDWLIYGEDKYPDRYKKAVAETGLEYQTLRNYAWVARRFSPSHRRDGLSLQHHEVVAALPPQERDIWLDRAEHFSWSRSELRKQVQLRRAADKAPAGDPVTLRLEITPDREQRWKDAASVGNRDLVEWITEVLDEAAEASVHGELTDMGALAEPA
jgi:hypothetical protein